MKEDLPILIEPSLLSCDFGNIADESKRVEDAGADAIHIDIMDGHFVPNLTLGPKAVAAVNRATDLFLDVHVMIYNPYDYIERLVEAGADRITFHIEATEDVGETLDYIRKCNIEAGLAIRPETSPELITRYLNRCDLILIMTVNPGFGGQAFMPEMLDKIAYTRHAVDQMKVRKGGLLADEKSGELPPFNIQVDGGIDDKTAALCYDKGANVFVSGTYLYEATDMKQRIEGLRKVGQ